MNHANIARSLVFAGTLAAAACLLAGCGPATGTPTASESEPANTRTVSAPSVDDTAADASVVPGEDGAPNATESEASATVEVVEKSQAASAAKTDKVIEITFDDLKCNMQEDIVFRPWMLTDRAKELDGSRIRVTGFMMPFDKQEGIENFVLLRNTECKFGPGGKADHLVQVFLQDGVTTSYRGDRPMEVVGTLKINPFQGPDGNTWCIYDLMGDSVAWKRR